MIGFKGDGYFKDLKDFKDFRGYRSTRDPGTPMKVYLLFWN